MFRYLRASLVFSLLFLGSAAYANTVAPIVISAMHNSGTGLVYTSLDNGTTWKMQDLQNPDGPFVAILNANNQFAAACEIDTWASVDGLQWQGPNSQWMFPTQIIYANNQFFSVGSLDGQFATMTSSDGVNWNTSYGPSPAGYGTTSLTSVAWGNNQYVAVGVLANQNPSASHKTFHRALNTRVKQPSECGGGFTCVNIVATSADGANWKTTIEQPSFTSIVWHANQFVTVGTQGEIATSPDGVNWTYQHSNTTGSLVSIIYANNSYVVIGTDQANPFAVFELTSQDAIHWSKPQYLSLPTPFTLASSNPLIYKNNEFMLAGTDADNFGNFIVSEDGIHWAVKAKFENFLVSIG